MNGDLRELNFDGLIGPTHNYAGLSPGNLASLAHRNAISNPRQAALQGLQKMALLHGLGVAQAILPPHPRPHLPYLRSLGFTGSDARVLEETWKADPCLLGSAWSASAMWAANGATVTPSPDADDGRLHITPANLISQPHRSLEAGYTHRLLRYIFADEGRFAVHPPLPAADAFADEGAANHTRLSAKPGGPGVHLFNYGRDAMDPAAVRPGKYPARQTLQASQAIARRHRMAPGSALFIQQHPAAIDAGVFHNDVIATGHGDLLLCHENAFMDQPAALRAIREAFARVTGAELRVVQIAESRIPMAEVVGSYLFNSQLISLADGSLAIIHPTECSRFESTRSWLDEQVGSGGPIHHRYEVDLRQSMQNGGGPACLRLRTPMTAAQMAALPRAVLYSPELHEKLAGYIQERYRPTLTPDDLRDPAFAIEAMETFIGLARLMGLPEELHTLA